MRTVYRLKEDSTYDSEGALHIAYGIEALNDEGTIVKAIADIFFNKATGFIALCNELELSLVHLPDVIEDILE